MKQIVSLLSNGHQPTAAAVAETPMAPAGGHEVR
jgi:hypothetical protein